MTPISSITKEHSKGACLRPSSPIFLMSGMIKLPDTVGDPDLFIYSLCQMSTFPENH